jgi:hypothetical protein
VPSSRVPCPAVRPDARGTEEPVPTAYHEAGHAVAAVLLGRPLVDLALAPHAPDGLLGLCRYAPTPVPEVWLAADHTPPGFVHVRHEGTLALAGPTAEALYRGYASLAPFAGDPDYKSDFRQALDAAGPQYAGDDERAGRYLSRRLVPRVRRLLCHHWPAVDAVAAALLAKGRLDGPDVERLCAEAGR